MIRKCSNKNYSPTKVKSRNFLTNISYNCLKPFETFIIDCHTYIQFNLNDFQEQKFGNKSDREYIEIL